MMKKNALKAPSKECDNRALALSSTVKLDRGKREHPGHWGGPSLAPEAWAVFTRRRECKSLATTKNQNKTKKHKMKK